MNKAPIVIIGLLLSGSASAETLRDAVEVAYASNPVLAAARARQDALGETSEQARAGGRLTAAADAEVGYDKFDFGKGGAATVSASLPIWTGGRVSAEIRAAEGDIAAGRESVRDVEAEILNEVVSVYANLLYNQQAVDIAKADILLLEQQVAEAQARFKLGKATRTDVAQLEAQRATAVASLAAAEAELETTAAGYRATVGRDPGTLSPPPDHLGPLPETLKEARVQALASNPVYQQSLRAADAAEARIGAAKANGAPSLSLEGAYGYDARFAGLGDRTYPRAASGGLVLRVPILTGGLVASQVRQVQASHRATQFDAAAAAREATRSTDAAWAALEGARARAAANETGAASADIALKGVRAEYGFDLRSTLDILVADETLRASQLALARSRADALIAEASLLRSTGRLDRNAFLSQ